jgi:hypothetical protein
VPVSRKRTMAATGEIDIAVCLRHVFQAGGLLFIQHPRICALGWAASMALCMSGIVEKLPCNIAPPCQSLESFTFTHETSRNMYGRKSTATFLSDDDALSLRFFHRHTL